jgi:cobalt-zinc-cadmium efflux system protein
MGIDHDHKPRDFGSAFAFSITLNVALVVVQLVYGVLSGSLALVADAGHNFSDVLGLVLAWGAAILVRRKPTHRRTYGFGRSSILAAMANALLVFVAVGGIAWEAFRRFQEPGPVDAMTVIWVAALGAVINTLSAVPLLAGRKRDLNIRAAVVHLLADAAVSVGVVIAGVVVLFTGWQWIDPAISLLIAGVIVFGTWRLLRESMDMLLDAVPQGIDLVDVHSHLRRLPGVQDVHDLHVWSTSTTDTALTAHLVIPGEVNQDELLVTAGKSLHDRFGIEHTVLQIERRNLSGCCELPLEPTTAARDALLREASEHDEHEHHGHRH